MRVVIAEDSVLVREGHPTRARGRGLRGRRRRRATPRSSCARSAPTVPTSRSIDIRMPPEHTDEGLRAAREIRGELPGRGPPAAVPVRRGALRVALLERGAEGVGYLLKDRVADLERFVDAVRRVARGGSALDPEVVAHMVGGREEGRSAADGSPTGSARCWNSWPRAGPTARSHEALSCPSARWSGT